MGVQGGETGREGGGRRDESSYRLVELVLVRSKECTLASR